jgi:hypothetical protein
MVGIGYLVGMEQRKLRLYVEEGSQTCGSWVTCSLPVSLLWSFHQLYSYFRMCPSSLLRYFLFNLSAIDLNVMCIL